MKLNPSNISIIKRLLVGRHSQLLKTTLIKIEAPDLASLFSNLSYQETKLFLETLSSISTQKFEDTLLELPPSKLASTLIHLEEDYLGKKKLSNFFQEFQEETCAYFLSTLEEEGEDAGKILKENLLSKMNLKKKSQIEQLLNYPRNSAGRLMQTDIFHLSIDLTANEGFEHLRLRSQKESIYYIYCVDSEKHLIGTLSLRKLISATPETPLKELLKSDVISVFPETPSEDVARLVAHYDFVALPVVSHDKVLLGIITVDDVLDIIQDQATAKIYAQAGLQKDDRVFTSPLKSIKNRAPWMFLNLVLAGVASAVVSLFESTMSELIVLASLKNIVASTGGNTAIQSLTVVTRGLAIGDFSFSPPLKVILKETLSGVTIGILTGLGAAFIIYLWKAQLLVSVVIFISMTLTSFIASCFGSIVPLLFQKFKMDPALGSGVVVTIIVDIFSFFSFLGIASLSLRLIN